MLKVASVNGLAKSGLTSKQAKRAGASLQRVSRKDLTPLADLRRLLPKLLKRKQRRRPALKRLSGLQQQVAKKGSNYGLRKKVASIFRKIFSVVVSLYDLHGSRRLDCAEHGARDHSVQDGNLNRVSLHNNITWGRTPQGELVSRMDYRRSDNGIRYSYSSHALFGSMGRGFLYRVRCGGSLFYMGEGE